MKGFFLFLIFSFMIIFGFIAYSYIYPSDGMIVRQNGKWVIVEHNSTKR